MSRRQRGKRQARPPQRKQNRQQTRRARRRTAGTIPTSPTTDAGGTTPAKISAETQPATGDATRPPGTLDEPVTVTVLVDECDFAALYGLSWPDPDAFASYLDTLEQHVTRLHRGGARVRLVPFAPEEYEEYCAERGLPGRSVASQTEWAGVLARRRVGLLYTGEPFGTLLDQLWHFRVNALFAALVEAIVWEAAARAGEPEAQREAAFRSALRTVGAVLQRAGSDALRLSCAARTPEGVLSDSVWLTQPWAISRLLSGHGPTGVLLDLLSTCHLPDGEGVLLLRSRSSRIHPLLGHAGTVVRGWRVRADVVEPLSAAEVFASCCTDGESGQLIPPELGVEHDAGFPLSTSAPDDDGPTPDDDGGTPGPHGPTAGT